DRQRPLRDRDLGDVGIDVLERAIDARVRVVQQLPIALFVEGHVVALCLRHRRENAIQKSKPDRRTSIGNMSPVLYPPSAPETSAGVRTAALPIRRTTSPTLRPA